MNSWRTAQKNSLFASFFMAPELLVYLIDTDIIFYWAYISSIPDHMFHFPICVRDLCVPDII